MKVHQYSAFFSTVVSAGLSHLIVPSGVIVPDLRSASASVLPSSVIFVYSGVPDGLALLMITVITVVATANSSPAGVNLTVTGIPAFALVKAYTPSKSHVPSIVFPSAVAALLISATVTASPLYVFSKSFTSSTGISLDVAFTVTVMS